jgi:hypothetical protein
MITIRLNGGLSNQMFQYAAARALAQRYDGRVRLDRHWFSEVAARDTKRHFELDCFAFPKVFQSENPFIKLTRLSPQTERAYQKLLGGRAYIEPDHNFHASFFDLPDHSLIIGFYQSEKYFLSEQSIIRKDFEWANQPTGKNKTLLERIQKDVGSVSLHIRRGDYVTNAHAHAWHGVLDLAYYEKAMREMSKYVKQPTFYVFSNDPEWCKQNIKTRHKVVFVDHNDDQKNGHEDMRLMKNCRHNITANSSMSWWGAWLNQNPEKRIIAPKRWFVDPSMSTRDLIPKSWVQL